MAAAVIERTWRDAAPETVEHELAALWREIARRGTVARAVMSNLVVFRYHERRGQCREGSPVGGAGAFSDLVDAVVARHPSRAILIEHDRGQHDTGAPLGAGVGVSIFGPPAARYGVESIVVRSACAEASLPSIVRRFMRGGLPTSIWWTEDLSIAPPLPSLVAMARQLVYDSRAWRDVPDGVRAVTSLNARANTDLADLNWRRLKPVRELLVHAAASCGGTVVAAGRVQIQHGRDNAALAWLLAGWLAARLEWSGEAWPEIALSDGDEKLALTVRDGDFVLTIALNDRRVRLEATGRPPIVVAGASEDAAEAVAAELRTLPNEIELHDALTGILRRLERTQP